MRILLAGGGTGGPVMPLIAVAKKIKEDYPRTEFLFVGTYRGLERNIVEKNKLRYVSVPAGKWRRYFSLLNIFTPFFVFAGFLKSLYIIARFKPDVIFSAGGFVSVPVSYAAFVLRRKIVIHQQDAMLSLTNKLLAPIADKITVSFEHSLKDFRSGSGFFADERRAKKTQWTGNPVREELFSKPEYSDNEIKTKLHLKRDFPTILILGGATGAASLNAIIESALPQLVEATNVIHSTGKGKGIEFHHENYHPHEFISDMKEVYQIADIVISRAGLSTLTELSALKKVAIVVPLPESHQLLNAFILGKTNSAIVINQEDLYPEMLVSLIRRLLLDGDWQHDLTENMGKLMPKNATQKIATIIEDLCSKK